MERIGYLTVKIVYKDNTNPQIMFEELDYYFKHDNIIETELINFDYKEGDSNGSKD